MEARIKKMTKDLLRASTGRLADALCSPSTTLVIFSRGRTGSNLLASLLKSHPQVRHHGEILGESYLRHDFIRNEINRIGSVPYFEWSTRRMLTERVVGVKFLYHQLESEYARRWDVPDIPAVVPALEERTELPVIHLKRRNLLATLVSWKLAHQTHRWHQRGQGQRSQGDSVDGEITIDLSYDECRDEFTQTEERQRFYDTAFAKHPFVEMYYEDLVADRRGEMARVLKLLNLESYELQSPLRKQSTRTLKDILANFVELRQRFAGTPYAEFFTDPAP